MILEAVPVFLAAILANQMGLLNVKKQTTCEIHTIVFRLLK